MIDRLGIRVSSFFLFLSMGAAWGQQAFVPQVIATPGAPSAVLYGLYRGSVVKSADLGSTWNPIYITTPGLPQPPVQGFDIDQLNPSTVYFATSAAVGAFWKSTDGGATWAKANTGLPSLGATVDSFKQILDTANQVTLLYVKIGDTLYKSANQGASWSFVGYLPGSTGRIAIAGSRQSWMYYLDPEIVQVWFSGDEGHSWSPIGTVPAMFPAHIIGMDVLYFNPS
ncbi:MAG TPA: sialidase family protein, partial [Bryobacteraceae bacterium]|nr:sialidase family protein [Bryobacteraceae bacterium]